MKQDLPNLPFFFCLQLSIYVLYKSLSILFMLAIVLPVLPFAVAEYSFDIFKPFLYQTKLIFIVHMYELIETTAHMKKLYSYSFNLMCDYNRNNKTNLSSLNGPYVREMNTHGFDYCGSLFCYINLFEASENVYHVY